MNRFVNVLNARLIATVALALAMTGLFTVGSTAHAQSDDEAAVREVLTRNAAAFERGDMNMLNKLWANDESVTVFESGHANYGWADYRDNHLKPEMAEMKNTKYAITDVKPSIAGNTAWGYVQVHDLRPTKGAPCRSEWAWHGSVGEARWPLADSSLAHKQSTPRARRVPCGQEAIAARNQSSSLSRPARAGSKIGPKQAGHQVKRKEGVIQI